MPDPILELGWMELKCLFTYLSVTPIRCFSFMFSILRFFLKFPISGFLDLNQRISPRGFDWSKNRPKRTKSRIGLTTSKFMWKSVHRIAYKCQEIVDFDVGIIRNQCVLIDFDGVSPSMDRFWPRFIQKSLISRQLFEPE